MNAAQQTAKKYNLDPMETATQILFDTFISENKLPDDLSAEDLIADCHRLKLTERQMQFLMAFMTVWESVY